MVTLSSGAPRYINNGIQDGSLLPDVVAPETYPQLLPVIGIQAERGRTDTRLINVDQLTSEYGSKTFDPLSKYYSHSTRLLMQMAGAGQSSVYIKRLSDNDDRAAVTVGVEIVADQIPQYKRNADGTYARGTDGKLIADGDAVDGLLVRTVVNRTTTDPYGEVQKSKGELTSSTGVQSDYYPLFQLQAPGPGVAYQNMGLAFWSPTLLSNSPVNNNVIEDQVAYLFRMAFVERKNINSTASRRLTTTGDAYVDVAFKKSAIDENTKERFYVVNKLRGYSNQTSDGSSSDIAPPFGNIKLYEANLKEVLGKMYAAEEASVNQRLVTGGDDAFWQMNFAAGTYPSGAPYYNVYMQNAAEGSDVLADGVYYYGQGGKDGDITAATQDTLMQTYLENFGVDEALLDDAKFPFNSFWDSGYSATTKQSFIELLGKRKDMYVVLSTFIHGQSLTMSQQRSLGYSLRTQLDLFPESTLYGTQVCRAAIVMQDGYMIGDEDYTRYSHINDLAVRMSAWVGAANGLADPTQSPDAGDNRIISTMYDFQGLWETNDARDANFSYGLIYAQTYDTKKAFRPALTTVYSNESSVLKELLTVHICVDVEKEVQRVWRDITGDGTMDSNQYLEKCNTLIQERTAKKYGGRVTVVPNCYYTEYDRQSRNRLSCDVTVYANKPKYQMSFSIIAKNSDDLPAVA